MTVPAPRPDDLQFRRGPDGLIRGFTRPAKPTRDEAHARRQPPVPLLTVAEVAAALRVSKMTVYRLVHAKEIASVRVGRNFRIAETAVAAYLGREA
jgi:excisionase family DNA binding protein